MVGIAWMAPLTGALCFALLLFRFTVVPLPPFATAVSVDEMVKFYVDHGSMVYIGAHVQALACAMFLFFAAVLYKTMRAAGADASAIGLLAGAAVFTVGGALDETINAAAAAAAKAGNPVAVQALSILYELDYLPPATGMFVFLMSWGVGIIQHGVFPRWAGWILVLSALPAISSLFIVSMILGALAVLAAGVVLTFQARKVSV